MGKDVVTFRPNFRKKFYGERHDVNSVEERAKFRGKAPIDPNTLMKYTRGDRVDVKDIKIGIGRKRIERKEKKWEYSSHQSARSEILLTEGSGYIEPDDGEVTRQFCQTDIVQNVDAISAAKRFDLSLNFGPYRMNYTRNGRYLVIGGRKGHVSAIDWITKKLLCEINVMESAYDVAWLHQETMFAVAQKKWLYIYDNTGTEIHCIKKLDNVFKLEFLPYHFLLSTVSTRGFISWLDVSIGKLIQQFHIPNHGSASTVAQCPSNALMCVGQTNGVISLWSPNDRKPVITKWCHRLPLCALAFDPRGNYLATASNDRSMKLWDARQLKDPIQEYNLNSVPHCLSFSHKETLAVGLGNIVEIYRDPILESDTEKSVYLRHKLTTTVMNMQFCPYEDVLGIAHSRGFSSILVPGSGEPNFDALETNPYQSKSQRREAEVQALLGKIPFELITWDPAMLQKLHTPSLIEIIEKKKQQLHVKVPQIDVKIKNKNANSAKKAKTKKMLKEEAKRQHIRSAQEKGVKSELEQVQEDHDTSEKKSKSVLDRFIQKPKKK